MAAGQYIEAHRLFTALHLFLPAAAMFNGALAVE